MHAGEYAPCRCVTDERFTRAMLTSFYAGFEYEALHDSRGARSARSSDFSGGRRFYAQSALDGNGTLNGDLTLYGRGAPDLYSHSRGDNSASLAQLADDLFQRGLRRIRGNVVGDESYFRAEAFGNGWQWNDLQWYFGAEPSALTINDNQIDVEIKPSENAGEQAQARLTRAEDYAHLINELTTVKRGEQMTVVLTGHH